jgi:hypothetical protein
MEAHMNASGLANGDRGWVLPCATAGGARPGAAGEGRGTRSRGDPPKDRLYDELGAKILLIDLATGLRAELPKIRVMLAEFLDDGYTLPEAASFILSIYDVLEPQIRAAKARKRSDREELIRNPETRRRVIPEDDYEIRFIELMDEMDRTQQRIDATGEEIERMRAETAANMQRMVGGEGLEEWAFAAAPSSDPEVEALRTEARVNLERAAQFDAERLQIGATGERSSSVEPAEAQGKKKVQTAEAVVKPPAPALPPRSQQPRGEQVGARGPLARLRSLFS